MRPTILPSLPFIKMHGLGNDFVIIDARQNGFMPDQDFCLRLADRHRGIGYDQLIILTPPKSDQADLFVHFYNADGTTAQACGNGTRCIARLLFEEKQKQQGKIETISGILSVWQEEENSICVDFGNPGLAWHDLPLAQEMDTSSVDLGFEALPVACCVSVGNPHTVFFVKDVTTIPLETLGPKIEHHPLFPERTNVEFAQILDNDNIRMRVWERGTGITQACGSGALATFIAARRRGFKNTHALIHLDGGKLKTMWREENGHVILCGAASLSFCGTLGEDI